MEAPGRYLGVCPDSQSGGVVYSWPSGGNKAAFGQYAPEYGSWGYSHCYPPLPQQSNEWLQHAASLLSNCVEHSQRPPESRGSATLSTCLAMTDSTNVSVASDGTPGGGDGGKHGDGGLRVRVLKHLVMNTDTSNIGSLPGTISLKLQTDLDMGDNWKKLIMAADHTRFKIDVCDIPKLEKAHSPTNTLLLKFSMLDMSVQALIELLAQACLDHALEGLREPEELQITQEPPEHVTVEEGETLTLTCEAEGFPPPCFEWYHHHGGKMEKVLHETMARLRIPAVRPDHEGSYVCQVNNASKLNFPQSKWCKVSVRRAPAHSVHLRIVHQTECMRLTLHPGQCLQLECRAVGYPQPDYRWYKDGECLLDHKGPVLNMTAPSSGNYSCMIRNGLVLESNQVFVNIVPIGCDTQFHIPATTNTARAKVALLVGTGTYQTACTELPAARNDVQALEKRLTQMDFMVISLLDLSKEELIQHVLWFCKLVDEGVYVLFFYIGHGFDHYGQSFLIPWDAEVGYGTKDCVHLKKDILCPILKRKPSMCFAIIDICRCKSPQIAKDDHPEEVKLPAHGTTCIFYATSPDTSSYEDRLTKQGIFMTHLLKEIGKRVSVQELHTMVLDKLRHDPMAGKKQYPTLESNLNSKLGLHDPIDTTGHTKSTNEQRRLWLSATQLPRSITIPLDHIGFKVHIEFTKLFSNHLIMRIRVLTMGSVSSWLFNVDVPPEITGKQKRTSNVNEVEFLGLQRLNKPLRPTLAMKLFVEGKYIHYEHQLDLGEPLIAKLQLQASPLEAEHKGTSE